MEKKIREDYIFKKKCLLILLYLCYIDNFDYKSLLFRNFGFTFEEACNFKIFIKNNDNNFYKGLIYIYEENNVIDYPLFDKENNINIFKVDKVSHKNNYYKPKSALNIYFDESNFLAVGYLNNKYTQYLLIDDTDSVFKEELLFKLAYNNNVKSVNSSANSFILWLLRFYSSNLNLDLVLGAGINLDYGAKDWHQLVDALNLNFYDDNKISVDQIKKYVGHELFVSSKLIKTNGFDVYDSLNQELYLFKEAKSFNDSNSTLYHIVDFIENSKDKVNVITYNYDTNLEYLLRNRNILYNTIYDNTSFINKDNSVDIFHVHGLLPYNKMKEKKYTNSLIFSESEYFYLYNNPYSWNIRKQLHDFSFNCCLFIGISLTDPNMKRLLELATNYLKFNFIFIKKNNGINEKIYRDVSNYFFTYDLITIWIDEFDEINDWLQLLI